jgi:hypothetical protein
MAMMDSFEVAALILQRRESELTPIIFSLIDEVAHRDRGVEGTVDLVSSRPPEVLRSVELGE